MEYEKAIRNILRQMGVGKNYTGYDYAIYGMMLVLEDRERLTYITKLLYPEIAAKYRTSWKCVERDIRTVVKIAWEDGDERFLNIFCGGEVGEKPKNAKFFAMMYEFLNSPAGELAASRMEDSYLCDCVYTADGEHYGRLKNEVEELLKEIQRLNGMVDWMHDLIWELIKVIKGMTNAGGKPEE